MNPLNVYRIGWHNRYKSWWRGWHRPWQCENDAATHLGARRGLTRDSAQRRMYRTSVKAGAW